MSLIIREMTIEDYEMVIALWQICEGIGLSSADSIENIEYYLDRNPEQSWVAFRDNEMVGAVLCGNDGRRGYIHHLAVSPRARRLGAGRALAERCLQSLAEIGIVKCHIFVYADNPDGLAFWKQGGWVERTELVLMSHDIP